jgi:hypothetical protein
MVEPSKPDPDQATIDDRRRRFRLGRVDPSADAGPV